MRGRAARGGRSEVESTRVAAGGGRTAEGREMKKFYLHFQPFMQVLPLTVPPIFPHSLASFLSLLYFAFSLPLSLFPSRFPLLSPSFLISFSFFNSRFLSLSSTISFPLSLSISLSLAQFLFFSLSSASLLEASSPPIERRDRENECGCSSLLLLPIPGARRNHPTETIRPSSSYSFQPASPPPSCNADAGDYLESFTLLIPLSPMLILSHLSFSCNSLDATSFPFPKYKSENFAY